MTKKQKKNLGRMILASVWLVLWNLLPLTGIFRAVGFLGCYLFIGYDILRKAGLGILNRNVFNENFLMAVATIGTLVLSFLGKTGDYNEAILVMLLYQIGEWFQSYAVGKSRKSIASLMDIRPEYANMEKNGVLVQVSPEGIQPGDCILIHPGEKIPLDATVLKGNSSLDTSALTGESLPREVAPGDEIISGCINLNGVLTAKVTKSYHNSTVAKILELVEIASARKSKSEQYISRFARVYTPFVCISALCLAVFPPLLGLGQWGQWVYRALTFLVISCPCALVISVPLSFFAGIGGAGRKGILIKGSNYLETLSQVQSVVFDKTGTLTKGEFSLTDIVSDTWDKETLLEYGAYAESASTHPIAKSICRGYPNPIHRERIDAIEERSGCGVVAVIDGHTVAVGNARLMKQFAIEPAEKGIHIAIDGVYAGYFVVSDTLKSQSADAIRMLKKQGVVNTVMLTGDHQEIAKDTAESLGLDAYFAELLPAGKVEKLEDILTQSRGKVAFVGDGINDAPVLTRADVGIAMGVLGSDAAIEAADVVLMDDDPQKIAVAIRGAKHAMTIVRQNIIFAVGVKFLCLALGAVGIADMSLAIFADVGVMVLAVLNAMRAMSIPK